MASYVELSQRYTKVNTHNNDWYVTPPEIAEDEYDTAVFRAAMRDFATVYEALLSRGYKPEDARYALPQATKTAITMSMNVRELFAFLDLRQDKAAQWEIRELANELEKKLRELSDEWETLLDWRKDV